MTQRLSFNSSNSGSQQSNKVVPLLDLNGLKQVEALHALLHFLELHRSKRKSCVDVSQCQNEDICNMVKAVLTNRKMIFEREEGLFWIRTRSGMSAWEIERKYKNNNNTAEEQSLPRALALRDSLQAALKQQMRGTVSVQSSSSSSGSSNGAQHQQQKQDETTIKQQTDSWSNQIEEDKQQKSNNNEKHEDDNSNDDDEKSFASFCQNEMERMQFAKALELSKTQCEREEQEFTHQLELAQQASALQSAQRQRDLEAQEQQDLELALTLSKQVSVPNNSHNNSKTPREPNVCLTPRVRRTMTTTTTKIVSREPTTMANLRPSPRGREPTPPRGGQQHHHQQQPKSAAAVGRGMERDTLKSLLNAARTAYN